MTLVSASPLSVSGIEIDIADQIDQAEWDAYVRGHARGSFFHLSGWGAIARDVYNYEPVFLTARRDGALCGLLPLIDVRAPLLGRSLISTAFTIGGGPLCDDSETLNALLGATDMVGAARGVRYIECRSEFDGGTEWHKKESTYANFKTSILADEAEALKAIPKRRRADVRKGINAVGAGDLTVRHDGDIDMFYAFYARALHQLGTPVFPKKFLRVLVNTFNADTEIAIAEYRGAPVAALLTFYHGDAALPYYIGASPAARQARAFDYINWAAMRHAAARGYTEYDFGRSKLDSGSFAYKKLWGVEPEPLTYRVKLLGAKEMPNINPNNPKFSMFSKLWPRMPLAAANMIGPLLAPNFP